MTKIPTKSLLLQTALDLGLCKKKERLERYCHAFYGDVDLKNKRVLDVGAGNGILSAWAIYSGARVDILEPDSAGSIAGGRHTLETFFFNLQVPYEKYDVWPITLQKFETRTKYDVIVIGDAINHLSESAVQNLLVDDTCMEKYITILRKITSLAAYDCILIITDCRRKNFFDKIGVRSPFMPTIEWGKHHEPSVWSSMFEALGWRQVSLAWSVPNRIRRGKWFFRSNIVAYILMGHFRLVLKKHTVDEDQNL